ncbi:MAG: NUDIX domain-containing protein [Caulobacterales bacterium]
MPRILRTETVYSGYATVRILTLANEDGSDEHLREVVSFGQSACVLPYDPRRRVALVVRLPRAPLLLAGIDTPLVEAPAGMVEDGEAAEVTARREALEEAGVVLATLEPVGVVWPSPGVLAERSHLFLAPFGEADRRGEGGGLAQEHEAITAAEMPLAELWSLAQEGRLTDLKTLTLVLALRVRRPELF